MRIILNSDVLYTNRRPLAQGLPEYMRRFCEDVAAVGAQLTLPRTVTLEVERHQDQLRDDAVNSLASARDLLRERNVDVPEFDPRELVADVDIATALRGTGAAVETCDPTLGDYREAERRACLHLPPQPPDTQTDEMRDLVIWAFALRIAKRDGSAMLVSRDSLHSDSRGRDEAEATRLYRAKNFAEASEILGRETPAGKLARQVLATVWGAARAAGLPLPSEVLVTRFTDLQFTVDEAGHSGGNLGIVVCSGEGPEFSARIRVRQAQPSPPLASHWANPSGQDATLGRCRGEAQRGRSAQDLSTPAPR